MAEEVGGREVFEDYIRRAVYENLKVEPRMDFDWREIAVEDLVVGERIACGEVVSASIPIVIMLGNDLFERELVLDAIVCIDKESGAIEDVTIDRVDFD